jgi:hypothetical protein
MANWVKNVLQVNLTTDFLDCVISEKRVESFFDIQLWYRKRF